MRRLLTRKLGVLVPAVVAMAVAASVAWATIPDSHGVIHSCVKDNGDVRFVDQDAEKKKAQACKKNEDPVDFNQAGPTGLTGAKGDPGPKGDTGPTGPSAAFTTTEDVSKPIGPGFTTVGSLALAPGSYVFLGTTRVFSDGAGTNVACRVSVGGGNSEFVNVNLGASPDRKIVALNHATTLSAASTALLECFITTGGAASADEVMFTAIKVGSVTTQ